MGYTHYWNSASIPEEMFSKLANTSQQIINASGVPLADWNGNAGTDPEVTKDLIRFNGVEDDAHETFQIQRNKPESTFCKTAYKPYDIVVVAILCAASRLCPGHIGIESDGNAEEWQAGLKLAQEVLPGTSLPPGIQEI